MTNLSRIAAKAKNLHILLETACFCMNACLNVQVHVHVNTCTCTCTVHVCIAYVVTFGRLQHCTFITLVWVRSLQERYNGSLLYKSFTCRFSRRMSFSFPNHGRVFGGTFVQPVSSQRSIRPIQVVGDSACCRCTSLS